MVKISQNEKPDSMLPSGWISIKKYRKKGASKGKCDITYYSPDSVPFRSLIAVKRFLASNADLETEEKEEGDNLEQNNVVSDVSAAIQATEDAATLEGGDSDGLIVVVDSESSDDSDSESQSMWL